MDIEFIPVKILERYKRFWMQLLEQRAAVVWLSAITDNTVLHLTVWALVSQNLLSRFTIWIHNPCLYSVSFHPLPGPLAFVAEFAPTEQLSCL